MLIIVIGLVLVFLYCSCWIEILENLFDGICCCIVEGIDIGEIDVCIMCDGVLVLMYDEIVDCMINGYGVVVDFMLVEI